MSYRARIVVTAETPESLCSELRALAHHIEAEHDLTPDGEVVSTFFTGSDGMPSGHVLVVHDGDDVAMPTLEADERWRL